MAAKVNPIPNGYEGATPYLICKGAAKAIEFYRSLHASGTVEQVLEKFRYIQETVALEHVVNNFAFGGLPAPKLNRSFQLFAEKVLPVLQNDPAFKLSPQA